MNENQNKTKQIISYILRGGVIFLIIYIVFGLFRGDRYKLTIDTTPADANIIINSIPEGTGHIEKNFKKGTYTIIVKHKDFPDKTQDIVLDKNQSLTITLSRPTLTNDPRINTNKAEHPIADIYIPNPNTLYGIDKTNGSLVALADGKTNPLYPGKVKDFSIKGNMGVLIDTGNLSQITILNLSNKSNRKVDLKEFSPIISAGISDDQKTIFFLAKFDISHKQPTLYSMATGSTSPTELTRTPALELDVLGNSRVILFEKIHALDQSIVHIYDIEKKSEVFSRIANSYSLAPSGKMVLLKLSRSLTLLNTADLTAKQVTVSEGDLAFWKSDNAIIAPKNTDTGADMAVLDVNTLSLGSYSNFLTGKQIKTSYGMLGNIYYFQGYDGLVSSTELK